VYGGKPHCEACPLSGRCRALARIAGALAAAPRAPKGETAYRYEDSNRFWRGRVLAKLREAPKEGVSLRELGAALHEGFGEGDLAWIRTVVESLEKDGLAVVYEQRPHGNRAEAVVEIRPVYGTEREVRREESARLPDGETRVRLP
jgi:A/G-specific adenine glycosylase